MSITIQYTNYSRFPFLRPIDSTRISGRKYAVAVQAGENTWSVMDYDMRQVFLDAMYLFCIHSVRPFDCHIGSYAVKSSLSSLNVWTCGLKKGCGLDKRKLLA